MQNIVIFFLCFLATTYVAGDCLCGNPYGSSNLSSADGHVDNECLFSADQIKTFGIDPAVVSCPCSNKHVDIQVNHCKSKPCQHGGTCTDHSNIYLCICIAGYSGRNCEININECESNPCQHGGTCTDHLNRYICACTAGYSGRNCEININDCVSNSCQHGGTCIDQLTRYTCACTAGYFGHNCQINRQCHSNPCVNGGTCNDGQKDGYTCKCRVGYTGHNCEIGPPITTVPQVILEHEQTINEGSGQEIIPCLANGIPDPIITWGALNGNLPSNARQVTHYLYFENVTLLDEGHYMCTANSSTGMDVKVIHIVVEAKPRKLHKAPVVIAPSIVHAKYYERISLICNVTGYPTPSVVWKHNTKIVQSSGNILVIPSVTNTTSGDYTCIGTNDAGLSQAKVQLVYTYDAPKIVSPPSSFVGATGQSHNFTCVATGLPKPAIKWEFYSFLGHGANFPTHVTTQNGSLLTLVKMQDSGTLTCTARNQFGVNSSTVSVIVKNGGPAVG